MVTDPISDLLVRIKNAHLRGRRSVRVLCSKVNEHVLDILRSEGFIESHGRRPSENGKFEEIEVVLKYTSNGRPGIISSRRVSKPGRRIYAKADKLPKVHCGLGISIVSTSQGIMSDREARKRKIGGEVMAEIA